MTVLKRISVFEQIPALKALIHLKSCRSVRIYYQRNLKPANKFACKWDKNGEPIGLHLSYFQLKSDYHCLLSTTSDKPLSAWLKAFQQSVISPKGEADELFEDVDHISMAVGDVIQIDDEYFLLTTFGFHKVLSSDEWRVELLREILFNPIEKQLPSYLSIMNSAIISEVARYYDSIFDGVYDTHALKVFRLTDDGTGSIDEVLSFVVNGKIWYLSSNGLSNIIPTEFMQRMATEEVATRSIQEQSRDTNSNIKASVWYLIAAIAM